jgi:hypothetical protein
MMCKYKPFSPSSKTRKIFMVVSPEIVPLMIIRGIPDSTKKDQPVQIRGWVILATFSTKESFIFLISHKKPHVSMTTTAPKPTTSDMSVSSTAWLQASSWQLWP